MPPRSNLYFGSPRAEEAEVPVAGGLRVGGDDARTPGLTAVRPVLDALRTCPCARRKRSWTCRAASCRAEAPAQSPAMQPSRWAMALHVDVGGEGHHASASGRRMTARALRSSMPPCAIARWRRRHPFSFWYFAGGEAARRSPQLAGSDRRRRSAARRTRRWVVTAAAEDGQDQTSFGQEAWVPHRWSWLPVLEGELQAGLDALLGRTIGAAGTPRP